MALLLGMVCCLLLVWHVLVTPLGVADGGGYYKNLQSMGLYYLQTPTNDYITTEYGVLKNAPAGTTLLQRVVGLFQDGGEHFSVVPLARGYGVAFLIALAFFLYAGFRKKHEWINFLQVALGVLIFSDLCYLLYFNTLFAQPLILITLLFAAGFLLLCHKWGRAPFYLTIPLAVFGLAFASISNITAWCAVVIGVLALGLLPMGKGIADKICIVLAFAVLAGAGIGFGIGTRPADYQDNLYNSVFFGMAKYDSVEELGLDPKLDELRETFATEEINQTIYESFYAKMNYGKLLRYYLTHPGTYFQLLGDGGKNATTTRISYLGNYRDGEPGRQAVLLSVYSALKARFFPAGLPYTMLFLVAFAVICLVMQKKSEQKNPILNVFIGLAVCALIAYLLPVFYGGIFEIAKAYYSYNLFFDLMLLTAVGAGGRALLDRREALKNKYGVTQ